MRKILIIALYAVPVLMLFMPHSISDSIITSENYFLGGKFFFSLLILLGINLIILSLQPTMKGWVINYKNKILNSKEDADHKIRLVGSYKVTEPEITIKPILRVFFSRHIIFPFWRDLYTLKLITPFGIYEKDGSIRYENNILIDESVLPFVCYDANGNELLINSMENIEIERKIKEKLAAN